MPKDRKSEALRPFAEDAASLGIGGLTIENGTTRLAIYGSLDIARNETGLELARQLRAILDAAIHVLETDMPAPAPPPTPQPAKRRNPFR